MRVAESQGEFDFEPNFDPATADPSRPALPFGTAATTIPTIGAATSSTNGGEPPKETLPSPSVLKRKNSLDDFELEIEGMNLDDNIDTSVSKLNPDSMLYLLI